MANVQRRRCRIYSSIDPDPLLREQSIQVISLPIECYIHVFVAHQARHEILPYDLIDKAPLLQHGQHTLLPPSLDFCGLSRPSQLCFYSLLKKILSNGSSLSLQPEGADST